MISLAIWCNKHLSSKFFKDYKLNLEIFEKFTHAD